MIKTIIPRIRFHRGLSLAVLVFAGMTIGSMPSMNAATARDGNVVVRGVIDMTCFPAIPLPDQEPGIGGPPPCDVDALENVFGLDTSDYYLDNPSGRLYIIAKENDTATFHIWLRGIVPGTKVTAYLIQYFPFLVAINPSLVPEVFRPIVPRTDEEGNPVLTAVPVAIAAHSVPLAPIGAAYSEGLGTEPHQIRINRHGRGRFRAKLNFNPLKPHQTPLRNGMVYINQGADPPGTLAAAPTGSIAEQGSCCPRTESPVAQLPQPVGASYVREYDLETGFQVLDEYGRPKLPRSPTAPVLISVIAHIDGNTRGMHPGIPFIPPDPSGVIQPRSGDHIVLGVFDLREFHLPE